MMVMLHNGYEKRCPFCFSRKLRVDDYDIADPKYWERFGRFWFKMVCLKCGGECEDINNLEPTSLRKEKAELKKKLRETQNENISV